MCETCRYYDPADGYCVMNAEYRRGEDLCDGYAEPKKWLFYMDRAAEKET